MSHAIHITESNWHALLADELSDDERKQIVAHLGSDCETCDEIIAGFERADVLDGFVDETLLELRAAEATHFDEFGFQRVKRKLKPNRVSQRTWAGISTAIAAGLAAFFLITPPNPQNQYDHLKGTGSDAALRLELLQTGQKKAVTALAPDQSLKLGQTIVFRLHLNQAGCVQLFEDQEALLSRPKCFDAGTHVVEENGQVLGLTLDRAEIITYSAQLCDADGNLHPERDSFQLTVLP